MTTIKFNAGETVYWLSTNGFVKGIVKSVRFSEDKRDSKAAVSKNLKYYLWCNKHHSEYVGDCVSEKLIFKTYEEMVGYYMDESATVT